MFWSVCSFFFYLWRYRIFILYRLSVNDFILKLSPFFINVGHSNTFIKF